MSEYNSVVQAVDVIRSFLNTHESNSTTCLWESDIDGTILKTDWGYFEEGLDEIRDYCERLDADRKTEPMKTTDYCDICKRDMCEDCVADATNPYCVPSHYEINYEPKDEPTTQKETQNSNLTVEKQTDCPWK